MKTVCLNDWKLLIPTREDRDAFSVLLRVNIFMNAFVQIQRLLRDTVES